VKLAALLYFLCFFFVIAELRLLWHAQHVWLLEARLGNWARQVHQPLQQVSET
jgi:hypothetical protein